MGNRLRAIVTGGLGFIGSHLVDRLVKDGWKVLIIDNLISGYNSNVKGQVDLLGKDLALCQDEEFHGYDALFHMAAYPIRRDKLFDSKIYFEQTEGGALAALEIARKNAIPVFITPASTTLYGSAKYLGVVPTSESYIGSDISMYGTAKFNSERWAESFSGLFDMNVLITCFGRILGPRSRNGSVWELVHRLRENPSRLEVLGDGSAVRSFLHVDDCIEGMMVAMQHRSPGVDRFNISNTDIATVRDLVDILVEESGLNPKVVYGTEKVGWKGDNEMVYPDASKLRSFGWNPKRDSKETIRDCVRWTLDNIK